jgi:hypothetical protein
MKSFCLFLLALIFAGKSFGQSDILNAHRDSVVSYADSVSVNGATKEDLFIRARDWLACNGKTLKMEDRESWKIIGTASMDGPVTVHYLGTQTGIASFDFVIIIQVKDGQYSYTITNIDNTRVNGTNFNGTFGFLYKSTHCSAKGFILSQAKIDLAYQSLKDGFDKSEKELVAFLGSSMKNP